MLIMSSAHGMGTVELGGASPYFLHPAVAAARLVRTETPDTTHLRWPR